MLKPRDEGSGAGSAEIVSPWLSGVQVVLLAWLMLLTSGADAAMYDRFPRIGSVLRKRKRMNNKTFFDHYSPFQVSCWYRLRMRDYSFVLYTSQCIKSFSPENFVATRKPSQRGIEDSGGQ